MRHFDFFIGKSPTAFIIKYHASRERKKALLQLGSHLFLCYFQADVVAQTHISYPSKELLQLIHSHLTAQG